MKFKITNILIGENKLKKKIIDILLLKTMFSKLLMSFLLIILTVSSFYLYAYKTYLEIIEAEITVNMDERFNKVVEKNEQIFENIKSSMVQLYYEEEFFPFINGQSANMYEKRALLTKLKERMYEKNYSGVRDYIKAIYVMPKKLDSIIVESLGTYDVELFYNQFFHNQKYTKDFWIDRMDDEFSFKIFKTEKFSNYSRVSSSESILTPFAFKKTNNSNCLLISLVKIEDIIKSIDKSFMDYYYIYNNNDELIYPANLKDDIIEQKSIFEFPEPHAGKKYIKTDNGYLFSRTSTSSGLKYYRLVPDAQLKQQLAKVNMVFRLILIVSLLFSMLISIFIVIKFNNPVKQIAELITQPNNIKQIQPIEQIEQAEQKYSSQPDYKNIFDLNYIRDNIKVLVEQNVDYARDMNARNSDLEAFLYQAQMKDIYIQADEIYKIKDKLTINQNYIVVYFKLHFKQEFFSELPHEQETSKITFLFKELIQLYIKEYFESSITFQAENKKIISILNVGKNEHNINILMNDMIKQLEHDEEYVYFTISISKIYDNISDLKDAYNSIFEISMHRSLLPMNQVLTEESIKSNTSKFYFSIDQMKEFTGLLRRAEKQESLKMVSDILEYNLKKNVNSFYIKLLCIEIINCSIKLLTRIYYDMPNAIDTANVYHQLNECDVIEEYEKVCHNFIYTVISYISNNKRENDYIIDYITNYVEENYMEDIYLDLFAEKLNLSTAYISSYFKTKLDTNLTDYINNYRIKKSIDLIENTQMKVKDIALQVGFANSNTFIRLFKKYSGFTPQEYRRNKSDI